VIETVVVSEEDRVVEAISKNEKSVVRLRTPGADGTSTVSGMGIVVSENGTVMVDSRSYNSSFTYSIEYHDGKVYQIGKVEIRSSDGLVFIKPLVPGDETPKYTFHPASFGDSDSLKIGQTIVALAGRDSNTVSMGRVKQLETNSQKKVIGIISDIPTGRILPGSSIINLSGEIVGVEALSGDSATYRYIPINALKLAKTEALVELAK
jgi:S1-C subfamily serine protease